MTKENNKILGTVLAGFLGSGKTTFLNRLLQAPHKKRVAVVVNELGEIGVDAALLSGDAAFVELDNGCLCCALNADLEATLLKIGRRGAIDHVVIETSGVAEPLPVLWTFSRPALLDLYRPNLILTLADAVNIDSIFLHDVARLQVESAHVLAVTKLDRGAGQTLAARSSRLRDLNSYAPIVDVRDESLIPAILDAGASPLHPLLPASSPLKEHAHAAHGFSSLSVSAEDCALSQADLEDLLDGLPPAVIRGKGVVARSDGDGFWIFHRVGDENAIESRKVYSGKTGVVCIGYELDSHAIKTHIKKFICR